MPNQDPAEISVNSVVRQAIFGQQDLVVISVSRPISGGNVSLVQADFGHQDRSWLLIAESTQIDPKQWKVHCSVREWKKKGRWEILYAHSTGFWTREGGVVLTDREEEVAGLAEAATRALVTRSEQARWLQEGRPQPARLGGVGITYGRDGVVHAYRSARLREAG